MQRLAGVAGLSTGLVVVAFAAQGWRVPGGTGLLGSDLFFSSAPTGELQVSPSGPFLQTTGLRPGHAARGAIFVRNQTGTRLAIRLRALPDTPDLDSFLIVHITAGRRELYWGSLGALRRWRGPAVLAPRVHARLDFEVTLPTGLLHGYQGRIVSAPFEFDSRPAQ